MEKGNKFPRVKFSPDVIKEAWEKALSYMDEKQRKATLHSSLDVKNGNEQWEHDTDSEFFSDYVKNAESATYCKSLSGFRLRVYFVSDVSVCYTRVTMSAPDRSKIEEIHQIFEKYAPGCSLPLPPQPPPEKPSIFIGHGNNNQWRDLKDHLHDQHGYEIEAYEIGARAGHAIRDILEDMLRKSSFAILVMTGEDKDFEGNLHPRDNVIHELGLFQGKLGFSCAIILLEEGAQEFSNIHGIHQIRYSKGKIKETFGEVLATLKREFQD